MSEEVRELKNYISELQGYIAELREQIAQEMAERLLLLARYSNKDELNLIRYEEVLQAIRGASGMKGLGILKDILRRIGNGRMRLFVCSWKGHLYPKGSKYCWRCWGGVE